MGLIPTVAHNKIHVAIISCMIREACTPTMLARNSTEALDRVAASQKVQSDRLEALEKQIRLNTLVTPTQVRYINDAIKKHARELLAKKEMDTDTRAVTKLACAIRKSITSRYGVAALHEVPKHEYSVVMQQIDTWNDMLP